MSVRGTQSPAPGTAAPVSRLWSSPLSSVTGLLILLLVAYPGWHVGFRLGLLALFAVFHFIPLLKPFASLLCRCLLPVLIGAICVEAYILVNEWPPAKIFLKYFRFHGDYNENFYSGVSTLYAIITALALVRGIEDFGNIKSTIAEEAYRLRTLDEMARYFNATRTTAIHEAVLGLRRQIIRYADNVAAQRDMAIHDENSAILRRCQDYIAMLTPEDSNDEHSLSVMMSAHGEVGILRSKRINAIGDKMPSYLLIALWLMALGLILPFMAGPLDENGNLGELRFGQYYIIFLMGSLNSFLLLMLSDISNPFEGFWQLDLGNFREFAETVRADLSAEEAGTARSAAAQ